MLGADVYICGRRGGVLDEAARELMDAHPASSGAGKVTGVACDIRVPEAIHEMMDIIWADGGALTGLVNNAAGNFISRTEDLSPRAFDAIANIVFRGSFFVTLDAGKRWIAEGKKASVVFVSSPPGSGTAGRSPCPRRCRRPGSTSWASRWRWSGDPKGIRFNSIAPGPLPNRGHDRATKP